MRNAMYNGIIKKWLCCHCFCCFFHTCLCHSYLPFIIRINICFHWEFDSLSRLFSFVHWFSFFIWITNKKNHVWIVFVGQPTHFHGLFAIAIIKQMTSKCSWLIGITEPFKINGKTKGDEQKQQKLPWRTKKKRKFPTLQSSKSFLFNSTCWDIFKTIKINSHQFAAVFLKVFRFIMI